MSHSCNGDSTIKLRFPYRNGSYVERIVIMLRVRNDIFATSGERRLKRALEMDNNVIVSLIINPGPR